MSGKKNPGAKRESATEAGILERIERAVRSSNSSAGRIRLGIGDDAALFTPSGGYDQILTCDWFLEGSHFLRDKHPPDSIGWKCLARAVSDVAAMGGVPRCFLLSLALPASHSGQWLDQFLASLRRASTRFACVLAGGDTTRNDQILINVTVFGEVRAREAILRSGAQAGDLLFVTGRLGEAELGLELLRKIKGRANRHSALLKKHFYPEPRLAIGQWLAKQHLASAMMDLSDGLSADLPRLCSASGVGARIAVSKIPVVRLPERLRTLGRHPLELALHGGDDYELLFTVSRKKATQLPRSFRGVPISEIGEVTESKDVLLVDDIGRAVPLPNRGWDPFRKVS